jgi:5'-nucleotidase
MGERECIVEISRDKRSPRVLLMHKGAIWLSIFAVLILFTSLIVPASAAARKTVNIQILNVSDWHGQLDPNNGVGGAAVLSAYFQQDRAANLNTLTLTAGDAYGASPPLSNFFGEEPAVKAMNLIGFDADTFGNHNFDRGIAHLQQMIDLAEFQYVSANLKNRDANLNGVKDFQIFNVAGVKVAVIGITNPEAPTLVFPGNFGMIEVTDPVVAANKARAAALRAGAQVFVVITHMGVTGFDASGAPVGPLIDFANAVGGFHAIFGDHTDVQYSGVINNQLVVENRSKGLTYSKTTLKLDPRSGRVISQGAEFVTPLASAVTPDQAIEDMLGPYRAALAAAFDEKIGVATDLFPRGGNIERLREVAIGNLITDAMRWRYGTQLAMTNGGGIRASLPSSYQPADTTLRRTSSGYAAGPPYDLVVGDVFTVLPFGNSVVTRNVTGALLYQVLEHSVAPLPGANGRFAQISGFKFTYDVSKPAGSRVVSVTLDDGTPILPDATHYTFATNDFVNAGGDGYTMLATGGDHHGPGVTREVMADVVLEYIKSLGTITPTTEGRITNVAQ